MYHRDWHWRSLRGVTNGLCDRQGCLSHIKWTLPAKCLVSSLFCFLSSCSLFTVYSVPPALYFSFDFTFFLILTFFIRRSYTSTTQHKLYFRAGLVFHSFDLPFVRPTSLGIDILIYHHHHIFNTTVYIIDHILHHHDARHPTHHRRRGPASGPERRPRRDRPEPAHRRSRPAPARHRQPHCGGGCRW